MSGAHDPARLEQAALGALQEHAARVGAEARACYGEDLDWITFQEMLTDDRVARYPVSIDFDASRLAPGEFAWAEARGAHPSEGYRLWIHPQFRGRDRDLVALAAYHLVTVNYGDIATRAEAEAFGAALLGIDEGEYYARVCRLVDELALT